MIYDVVRRALFHLEAEAAHEWTTAQMEALQQIPIALRAIARVCRPPASAARTLWGLRFPSPIGIAGGFDKNATLMPMLAALGFGFIEVGTVTLYPQPGNPRPRLFRYPAERALINRMGFNNDGADAVAARLRAFDRSVPLFVNVGKNRDVPLERATEAYVECYRRVAPHADAAVLNLSSPNTPGLRDLQRPEHLEALLSAIGSVRSGPVLVKIAPDLDETQLAEIGDVCVRKADGMICTNTTLARLPGMNEAGGLSGAPLMDHATSVLAAVRTRVGPDYPLIGVGGVFTPDDVRAKVRAGANLVQIYTSFIYEGPMIAKRLARA
ncbi:MAG: quinone-dependent dihydroorotate dehydrogenase [Acidobacteria bacterium]|nr:quinone-dependent dihydroorotate dehydrogenase [Acidobacteriota bacterium]MBV9474719.1 quinone-dependent dihydroorotate dehydrogenase [Acidobacteriota bacterium]